MDVLLVFIANIIYDISQYYLITSLIYFVIGNNPSHTQSSYNINYNTHVLNSIFSKLKSIVILVYCVIFLLILYLSDMYIHHIIMYLEMIASFG